jgi:hypothetical protein
MEWDCWEQVPKHRAEQFQNICAALGLVIANHEGPECPAVQLFPTCTWIHLHGRACTGKTKTLAAVRAMLERSEPSVGWLHVDCRTLVSGEQFMAAVAREVYAIAGARELSVPEPPARWNLPLFMHTLLELLERLEERDVFLVLHLEGIEWLRGLDDFSRILASLRRLSFFADRCRGATTTGALLRWSVLVESRLPPSRLFDPVESSYAPDWMLYFPPYDRAALRDILLQHCAFANAVQPREAARPQTPESSGRDLCADAFVDTLLDVCHDLTNDLNELSYWSDVLYPKYAKAWRPRPGHAASLAGAYSACLPYFRQAVAGVYARSTKQSKECIEKMNALHGQRTWREMLATESRLSNALVLAGYLAAHIPPSHDRKLFEKAAGGVAGRKRRRGPRVHEETGRKTRSFSLERLQRLLEAISERSMDAELRESDSLIRWSTTPPTGAVLAGLIGQGFFSSVTQARSAERQRLRCYVSRELAEHVARKFDMNLSEYISET